VVIAGVIYPLSERLFPGAPYAPGLSSSTEAQRSKGRWKLDKCLSGACCDPRLAHSPVVERVADDRWLSHHRSDTVYIARLRQGLPDAKHANEHEPFQERWAEPGVGRRWVKGDERMSGCQAVVKGWVVVRTCTLRWTLDNNTDRWNVGNKCVAVSSWVVP
jgi:hypothetical protein